MFTNSPEPFTNVPLRPEFVTVGDLDALNARPFTRADFSDGYHTVRHAGIFDTDTDRFLAPNVDTFATRTDKGFYVLVDNPWGNDSPHLCSVHELTFVAYSIIELETQHRYGVPLTAYRLNSNVANHPGLITLNDHDVQANRVLIDNRGNNTTISGIRTRDPQATAVPVSPTPISAELIWKIKL